MAGGGRPYLAAVILRCGEQLRFSVSLVPFFFLVLAFPCCYVQRGLRQFDRDVDLFFCFEEVFSLRVWDLFF